MLKLEELKSMHGKKIIVEAIDRFETIYQDGETMPLETYGKTWVAHEATSTGNIIELHTPKPPEYKGETGVIPGPLWACPNCGKWFGNTKNVPEHCTGCGQAIDIPTD